MERIILKHLTGSKTGQIEEFPLKHFSELLIGRDPGSTVQFHPERDDLVGRRHAKIEPDARNPGQFLIVDLASRNGTFLNRRRIYEPTRIASGDILQLGPRGPEFQFQFDSPDSSAMSPPRPVAAQPTAVSRPAPVSRLPLPVTRRSTAGGPGENHPAAGRKAGLGAAKVERMIAQRSPRWKHSYTGMLALIMSLISIVLLGFLYLGGARRGASGLTESSIADRYRDAVVSVESRWNLHAAASGRPLYHAEIENPVYERYEQFPVIGARRVVPLFVKYPDGVVEPVLSPDAPDSQATPFGAAAVGSGFVVTPDGMILTTRSVAAGWDEPFRSWSSQSVPGLIAVFAKDGAELRWTAWEELLQPPADWVPGRTRMVLPEGSNIADVKLAWGTPPERAIQGRHAHMNVRFAGANRSYPASLGRVSGDYSVAIIKIASDKNLTTADIELNDEPPRAGDRATVMGFPPTVTAPNTALADPTVHSGHVTRIMDPGSSSSGDLDRLCPGCFQLDIGAVDLSHCGGPVFNERGEVIGMYQNLVTRSLSASLGVPIRVGRELMVVRASN